MVDTTDDTNTRVRRIQMTLDENTKLMTNFFGSLGKRPPLSIWCRDVVDKNSAQIEETLVQPNSSGSAKPKLSLNQPSFKHMQGNTMRSNPMRWFYDGLIQELHANTHGSMGPQKQRKQLNLPANHPRNASHTVQGSRWCNGRRRSPRWSLAEAPLSPTQAQPPQTPTHQLQEAIQSIQLQGQWNMWFGRTPHVRPNQGPLQPPSPHSCKYPPILLTAINIGVGARDQHTPRGAIYFTSTLVELG
ncbi:hypothetical protein GQ55_9G286000 [Panicum hallii var. hallii]|uniref:Uncharacterized protein n=1 Tax=Panicum hallii var. hallii TaxID=1504633 RepID=A0A2T7C7V2_9POAL|nr:hypothetical protein GQ55_9G286000 [Panicum hallii var. hallii]